MTFADKTLLVTGAGSGIGRETCLHFAREGARVVATDVDEAAARAVRDEITGQLGGEALAIAVDVRQYAQVQAAVDQALAAYGQIDILVQAAGGWSARILGHSDKAFRDMPVEVLDWGLDVNLRGPVYFDRAVIGPMIEKRSGVIIHIGSIDGQTGSYAIDYSAAKSGVMHGLTKSMALYAAPYGVRVCCVSPGPVLTRPAMANMPTALGRAAETGEIVDMIAYLASDKAAFVTGANFLIDGGRNCGARETFPTMG